MLNLRREGSLFKEADFRRVIKDFEPIISPVIRSGFRSASGFDIVFADL